MEPEIVGEQRRRSVFFVVAGVAAAIIGGFAISYYVEANMLAMWTDIGMIFGLAAGCIALRFGVDELKVYRPVVLGVLIGLCYLATIRTSLLYYHLALPLLLFFFFGSREGLVWAGGFFLATAVVLVAPEPVVSPILETESKVRFLTCFLFVVLIGWSYERSRELFHDLLTSRNEQLQRETERLNQSLTQVREAEGRLQQTAAEMQGRTQLLEAVVNSIGDGVIVVDEKGKNTIFNPSAERILGDRAFEVSAETWTDHYDIFYPDGETRVPKKNLPLVRAISRGESTDDQDLFVRSTHRPDGVYLRTSARSLWNNAGSVRGGVVTFRDVTEQVMAQDALMQAFAQGRLEIVDTILHNIGNAINSVTTGIETVHRNLADDPSLRRLRALADAVEAHRDDWIGYIKNDSQGQKVMPFIIALAQDFASRNEELAKTAGRVKDRANHIVDIIRTQGITGSSKADRVDVNLRTAFAAAVGVLEDSLRKRSVRIDIDCECAPKEIRIQKSRFHQMIVNLTKNAMEAIDDLTASGGTHGDPMHSAPGLRRGRFSQTRSERQRHRYCRDKPQDALCRRLYYQKIRQRARSPFERQLHYRDGRTDSPAERRHRQGYDHACHPAVCLGIRFHTTGVGSDVEAVLGYTDRHLVWCLVNSHHNLRVFFAVGCVALPRVVPATARHRALPTTKNPPHIMTRINQTPH